MNEVWNLDPIYLSFEDPAFAADYAALEKQVEGCKAFALTLSEVDPLEGLRQGVAFMEEMERLAQKLAGFASLRQAANTKDTQAGSQLGRIMALLSGSAGANAAFRAWASKLPNLMELVQADESLKDYTWMFTKMTEASKYLLPGMGEEIMARMGLSGGDAWSDLQSYLTSTVAVQYRG